MSDELQEHQRSVRRLLDPHALADAAETICTVRYHLIGLHAAAALFRRYVLRDTTLVRMLPTRG